MSNLDSAKEEALQQAALNLSEQIHLNMPHLTDRGMQLERALVAALSGNFGHFGKISNKQLIAAMSLLVNTVAAGIERIAGDSAAFEFRAQLSAAILFGPTAPLSEVTPSGKPRK